MRPFSTMDGPMANTVAKISGPFMSRVMGPPESPRVDGSARVRSGLILVQLWPSLVVFHTCCDEMYSVFGSNGSNTIGNVHCQRSGRSRAGSPEKNRG
jgi:hypothetical protein